MMRPDAEAALEQLEAALREAAGAVAVRCRAGDSPDDYQWVAFELAWVRAELLAARVAGMAGGNVSALDAGLAAAFAAEAVETARARLEGVFAALGLDEVGLREVAGFASLRREAGSPAVLAGLGAALAEPGEIGEVRLEEAAALARDMFRRFAAEVVSPAAEAIHREDLTIPETLLQPLRAMGVFGLAIPEEYGGSAVPGQESTATMIAVTEALSEASLGAAGSLITRPEILARALLAGGTAAQKRRFLPGIAAGAPLCAISITEPDHGSDVAGLTLRATRAAGGWRLDGAKTWCTFAGKAGLLMVVARTDPDRALGHRGLSLFLVEKPSDEGHAFLHQQEGGGTLRGRAIPTIGYRGMHSFELAFEGWFVPEDCLVGGEAGLGRGFYLTMAGMVGGRIQTAGRALGVMRAALGAAIRYGQERRVFGRTLGDFQLTQVKLARMAARFAACRQLAYAVGRQMDAGGGPVEASLVKLLACRSAEMVTREAMQLHGGMGYAEEMPVSRYWLDARVLSIFEGAEETLALKVIARDMMGS